MEYIKSVSTNIIGAVVGGLLVNIIWKKVNK
jgi:hypothetical protein